MSDPLPRFKLGCRNGWGQTSRQILQFFEVGVLPPYSSPAQSSIRLPDVPQPNSLTKSCFRDPHHSLIFPPSSRISAPSESSTSLISFASSASASSSSIISFGILSNASAIPRTSSFTPSPAAAEIPWNSNTFFL